MMPALRKYRPSVWFLIGANLIPVLGVIVWGWSVFLVMFLYWLENVILGLINVLKTIFDPSYTCASARRMPATEAAEP